MKNEKFWNRENFLLENFRSLVLRFALLALRF